MAENKKCWACKRTLAGDSKLGLCPDCLNKYGSPAAAVLAVGATVGVRQLVKNGGKIVKFAAKIVRH